MSEKIDLYLDQENELVFKITVEGTSPFNPTCRLMLENSGMSLAFDGCIEKGGEVTVSIPRLDRILSEGTYKTKLEVIVDDRVFVPLELDTNFEKSITVTAESVQRVRSKPKASASLISSGAKSKARKKSPRVAQRATEDNISEVRHKISKILDSRLGDDRSVSDLSESQIRDLLRALASQKD